MCRATGKLECEGFVALSIDLSTDASALIRKEPSEAVLTVIVPPDGNPVTYLKVRGERTGQAGSLPALFTYSSYMNDHAPVAIVIQLPSTIEKRAQTLQKIYSEIVKVKSDTYYFDHVILNKCTDVVFKFLTAKKNGQQTIDRIVAAGGAEVEIEDLKVALENVQSESWA